MNGGWYVPRSHVGGRGLGLALTIVAAAVGIREILKNERKIVCGEYITSSPNSQDSDFTYTFDVDGRLFGIRGNPLYRENMDSGKRYCATFREPIPGFRELTEEPALDPSALPQPPQNPRINSIRA